MYAKVGTEIHAQLYYIIAANFCKLYADSITSCFIFNNFGAATVQLTIISNQHLSRIDKDGDMVVGGGDVDKERLCVLDFRIIVDVYAHRPEAIIKYFQHLN